MNPFYLLLVMVSALALPAVIYGQQKIKRSAASIKTNYADTMYGNLTTIGNFSKKELMKMGVLKTDASPAKLTAGVPVRNLSAKEQMKSSTIIYTPVNLSIPASSSLQNLSAKEKMKMAVMHIGNSFVLQP